MSHVDDGTLHAYLDGELSPAEVQGVDAHVAQCPACRGRLEEERALITRAGELLALAAPPDRELPPFRAGDVKPPPRLWWRVRLPLAWAATVVLALGIGTYLGSGSAAYRERPAPALAPPIASVAPLEYQGRDFAAADTPARGVRQQSRPEPGVARKRSAAPPAVPAPATPGRADYVARQPDTQVAAQAEASSALRVGTPAPAPAPAPQAGVAIFVDGRSLLKGSPISVDTARALLGADPLAAPGAPIRAIYRAREIGYSAVVIVEQALDSSTVIEVVNGRPAPFALQEVVVTGAGAVAQRPDSESAAERARVDRVDRAGVADSAAAAPAAKTNARIKAVETQHRLLRHVGELEIRISGPLPSDSLQKLLRLVQPVKP